MLQMHNSGAHNAAMQKRQGPRARAYPASLDLLCAVTALCYARATEKTGIWSAGALQGLGRPACLSYWDVVDQEFPAEPGGYEDLRGPVGGAQRREIRVRSELVFVHPERRMPANCSCEQRAATIMDAEIGKG